MTLRRLSACVFPTFPAFPTGTAIPLFAAPSTSSSSHGKFDFQNECQQAPPSFWYVLFFFAFRYPHPMLLPSFSANAYLCIRRPRPLATSLPPPHTHTHTLAHIHTTNDPHLAAPLQLFIFSFFLFFFYF